MRKLNGCKLSLVNIGCDHTKEGQSRDGNSYMLIYPKDALNMMRVFNRMVS